MPHASSVRPSTSGVYRHTVKRQREADLTSTSYAAIVNRAFAQRHRDTVNHEDMGMNIYVANFAYTTTEDDLRRLFDGYGTVESVRIITHRETGQSRGFGFVEMPNAMEATAAMVGLDGTLLGGQSITVSEARPREERGGPQRPRQERRPLIANKSSSDSHDVTEGGILEAKGQDEPKTPCKACGTPMSLVQNQATFLGMIRCVSHAQP
jgi:RNA recognition motif-containing protein